MTLEKIKTLQKEDGSFGPFHSMSKTSPITTEKVLRRLYFLEVDKDNEILLRTLEYIKKCLYREIEIPDRREKVTHWDVFLDLMFSSWLVTFDYKDSKVEKIISQWVNIISNSIINNEFCFEKYKDNFEIEFGKLKSGMRAIDPTNYYMVTLLKNSLNENDKNAYFNYVVKKGIYYIYGESLVNEPTTFFSPKTIYYLYAIKLASAYNKNSMLFQRVKIWINEHKSSDGYWYFDNIKPDGIIFPFSKNWQKKQNKLEDIKKYMHEILSNLE